MVETFYKSQRIIQKIKMQNKIKHHALNWWNNLTTNQQQDYEFKAFGYGDPFEDNSFVEADIIKMYKSFVK